MKNVSIDRKKQKVIRHKRFLRKIKINGENKPRLIVTKTNSHLYAQVLDDENSTVIAYVDSKQLKKTGSVETAKVLGEKIAKLALEKGVSKIVFDRNGQKFHGQVKALADAARETGLEF
ncbi:MAG: 50S ribosomal protein L18 [Mycoplasmataceae bacterium]|jgi:large subunit ribosomal protein L18|nr:50S ribosomal protein L18 [Mycoplasmataceae bacterium]